VLALGPALTLGPDWLDPATMLDAFGVWALWGAAAVVFAECGLMLGFFLPGDSLLFTVGLFVGSGTIKQPLWLACLVLTLAAFLGNAVGYEIGRGTGPRIFSPDRLFKREHSTRP
jgi:membrane protein DedA with SNARE-associated domain